MGQRSFPKSAQQKVQKEAKPLPSYQQPAEDFTQLQELRQKVQVAEFELKARKQQTVTV